MSKILIDEAVVKQAREAGIVFDDAAAPFYERFAKLVAEHEREACAKVAEQADNCMNDPYENAAAREIAAAIRARKNT